MHLEAFPVFEHLFSLDYQSKSSREKKKAFIVGWRVFFFFFFLADVFFKGKNAEKK